MRKDQLDAVRDAIKSVERQKKMLGESFGSASGSIDSTLRRIKEFQSLPPIRPELLEAFKSINKPSHSIPSFATSQLNLQVSKALGEHFRSIRDAYQPLLKNFGRSLEQFRKRHSELSSSLSLVLAASAFNSDEIRKLVSSMDNPQLKKQIDNIRNTQLHGFDKYLDGIRDTYFANIAAQGRRAIETGDSSEVIEFERLVTERIKDPRQSGSTKLEFIMLVFTVLSFLVAFKSMEISRESLEVAKQQVSDSKRTEQLQKENADKLFRIMDALLLGVKGDPTFSRQYSVGRNTELKSKPKFRSMTVGVVMAGTHVHVLPPHQNAQKYHKWLYIEAIDPASGLPQYGWVNKKYLKGVLQSDF